MARDSHLPVGMLKRLKSKIRRRKIKKLVTEHASEIVIGVAMGLLTDVATDFARRTLQKKLGHKFR